MADMKVYKLQFVNGAYTVPDLIIDWKSILSDKYNLWTWSKFKRALLLFYYSPNHEGSFEDVAKEFNENANILEGKIMNFCREVQGIFGTFSIMENNQYIYWPIAMDRYEDANKKIIWRLKPDLVDVIHNILEGYAALKEQFRKKFPLEFLRNMTLDQYTNLNRDDSFCYWLEARTAEIGSIWGGSALKFGIYRFNNLPKEGMPAVHDDKYVWYAKYNCDDRDSAFKIVKDRIVAIAENAAKGNLHAIEHIDIGFAIKWKIAYIYSDNKVVNLFTNDLLKAAAVGFGYMGNLDSAADMNEFIVKHYNESKESFYYFCNRIGHHIWDKLEDEKKYWLTGYTISGVSKLDEFLNDGVWKGVFRKAEDARQLVQAKSILKGDIIILKATFTKGEGHNIPSLRIQAVGKATSNAEIFDTGRGDEWEGVKCNVEYISKEAHDFDGLLAKYRKTIQESNDKIIIKFVKKLTGKLPEDEESPKEKPEETKPEEPEFDFGNDVNYYWLNANPKYWKVDSFNIGDVQEYTAYSDKGHRRQKFKYFEAAKPGDKLICYETTPTKRIKALCEFTQGLHKNDKGEEVIEFRIDEKAQYQVHWRELIQSDIFKNCELCKGGAYGPQGSLFRLTKEEYIFLVEQTKIEHSTEKPVEEPEPDYEDYSFESDPDKPFINKDEFYDLVLQLQHNKNIILQGAPGVGKSFLARKIAYQMMGKENDTHIAMVQFHQSYSYEDFIQGIRPTGAGFSVKNGIFYKFCKTAIQHPDEKYFFIIDEINRGNISKVFGELMLLIEADKRNSKYAISLTYSEEADEQFYVPENLYIIGCMNTADRSLAHIDYALRRRFSFIKLKPEFGDSFKDFLVQTGITPDFANSICIKLEKVNYIISTDPLLTDGKMIGHSYFCSYDKSQPQEAWWHDIMKYKVLPYIEEICFDEEEQFSKIKDILMG